jgi:hypothetical protein
MSQSSDDFVLGLKAAFPFMGQPAISLYQRKLQNWRLSNQQWDAALDTLIRVQTDGNPPQLSEVFAELKRQCDITRDQSAMGWASFMLDYRPYSIRIKYNDGWRISRLTWRDNHGVEHDMQSHVGELIVSYVPTTATDFLITPDNPPRPGQDDIPTDDERAKIIAGIKTKIGIEVGI